MVLTVITTLFALLAFSALAMVPESIHKPNAESHYMGMPLPRSVKCGQAPLYESQRVINSSNIPARESLPFMVNIKLGLQHWCGGAVYDKYTVISAAHCFWSEQNLNDLELFFADFDQKKGYKIEIGQQLRKVRSITRHPAFDQYRLNNDLAIIKLAQALPWNNEIQPICMPTVEVKGGENTIVMGWGYTHGTNDENKLNFAHVPVIARHLPTTKLALSGDK